MALFMLKLLEKIFLVINMKLENFKRFVRNNPYLIQDSVVGNTISLSAGQKHICCPSEKPSRPPRFGDLRDRRFRTPALQRSRFGVHSFLPVLAVHELHHLRSHRKVRDPVGRRGGRRAFHGYL